MNRKQIESFIERVCPDENVLVCFYRDSTSKPQAAAAQCFVKAKWIYFNLNVLQQKDYRAFDNCRTKYTILHELGHIVSGPCKLDGKVEFLAHKWGIETADRFGMDHVRFEMVEHMKFWGKQRWNDRTRLRRYILAYKLALKDKKFAKKYGLVV